MRHSSRTSIFFENTPLSFSTLRLVMRTRVERRISVVVKNATTPTPMGTRMASALFMLEASAFTVVTGQVMKLTLGRQRPNETSDPDQWFEHGDSFPSLHTGLAFAIGTVFAESGDDRYRLLRRVLGYGVAGATGYLRLEHNQHWASDVVAGAALGLSTAQFTLNRRDGDARQAAISVQPGAGGGVMLAFTVPLH